MIFDHKSIRIRAMSTGGHYTSFQLPHQKISIDLGLASESSIRSNKVFITHPHVDHAAGIVRHCSTREMLQLDPPTYYIGEEHKAALEDVLAAWRRLNRSFMPCKIEALRPNQTIDVNKKYFVRCFRSIHRIPCLGYILYERRKKLSKQFKTCKGYEISRLREQGIEIYDYINVPMFAYTGDSVIDVLERESDLTQCAFLAMEVTFFDERVSVENARRHGHIHIDELVSRSDTFKNDRILLMHLSARYKFDEAKEIAAQKLDPNLLSKITILPNISPFKTFETKMRDLTV